ncbi:GntR family transcriptional regulator [Roseibium sp.]|uniref:GntR family transcriptional regulator n=1 Tax=Roseibium sp. TaxID=1936156 RepID=UPI003A9734A4
MEDERTQAAPEFAARNEDCSGASTSVANAPKYQEIGHSLMQSILSGEYPAGSYLPSESALMRAFGVSRVTIRLALDVLRDANLVVGHQGKGYFIRNLQAVQDLGRLQGFGELMAPLGVETRSEVLSSEFVSAPAAVAAALNLKRNAEVVKIRRLRIAADETMSLDVSYFPPDIGAALLEQDLAHVDVFRLIETKLGIEIGFADISMTVVPAESDARKQLNIQPGDNVIRIERLTFNASGHPIDFEYLYVRPESYQFKVRVPRW